LLACLSLFYAPAALAESFAVDPNVGNSTFAAVFEARLGERITANSASVRCDLTLDEKTGAFSGSCSVPLKSIRVDSEDIKTEHFQQWATNKKTKTEDCRFEATLKDVRPKATLEPMTPVEFSADIPFTICGRKRADGGKERVTGTAVFFPPGAYGSAKTIRIRARIERFNREKYGVGPGHTEGWLARVQSLAQVVAEEGTIELTLFAKAK
jgi:hypothetical protein